MRLTCCAVLGLAMLAAGCTTTPQARPEVAATALTPTMPSGTATVGLGGGMSSQDASPTAADDQVSLSSGAPSRTADAAGPFGDSDLWVGAGPPVIGLQRSLGPGDVPGPLIDLSPAYAETGVFRVYDMCGRSEASFREGGDFSSVVYRYGYDTARRLHEGCNLARFMAIAESPWIQNEREYFEARSAAQAWTAARRDEHYRTRESAERESTGLPPRTAGFGFIDSESEGVGASEGLEVPFGIAFAAWDDPVDELRVLPETVAVSAGVLRGLARNWSRRLWAYSVTVTAEDREFTWPLSVQPGETVPFEIVGWDGPTDPERIEFGIDADMSWHPDPSRAFVSQPGTWLRLWIGARTQRRLPESVREQYPELTADVAQDSVSVGILKWDAYISQPGSHPGLADDVMSLKASDLRAYGAQFDRRGRVIDVAPAGLFFGSLNLWDASRNVEHDLVEVRSLPHPSHEATSGLEVLFDVHIQAETVGDGADGSGGYRALADLFDLTPRRGGYFPGGFVLWVGVAHPEQDTG